VKKEDYESWSKMADWEVLEFCAGTEHDARTHAARHIMEIRRSERAAKASERAAAAARWSAVAAFISAIVAIVALLK
jgi:hypothetical protein